MSSSESDDQDWFNKDEDEILQSFQAKVSSAESKNTGEGVEYIHGPSAADDYLQQKRLEVSSKLSTSAFVKRLLTTDMRKALNMEPLDAFLFVATGESDFFFGQISASDGLERVLLYLRIWHVICELELPGFQRELLQNFSKSETFLEHLQIVAAKLFQKSYKAIWKRAAEIDEILNAIKSLISRVRKSKLLTTKILDVISLTKRLIKESDNKEVVQRHACQQLIFQLDCVLTAEKVQLDETTKEAEIYPSLDELLTNDGAFFQTTKSLKNKTADEYLNTQKQILREDFMIPLREYVCELKDSETHSRTSLGPDLFEDVCIVLNADFLNVKRHEMIFIDILGINRTMHNNEKKLLRKMKHRINVIKTGSLLLLTTSKRFENLILAAVTYTDGDLLNLGYIGIEIVRQYNIGTVYDRPMLMFETPAFFEPYYNVYNYLNTCGDSELPMKRYIIDGERKVHKPQYLDPDKFYSYDGELFKVMAENPVKPKKLLLNQSQWNAYCKALSKEFCLIQGPPGTGKTHLSVHLVRTLIENVKAPIVLITYTNDSLDKVLLKLSAYTRNILRFGSQTRLPEISKFNIQFDVTQKEMANPHLKRLYYVINEDYKSKFQVVQKLHADFDGSEDSYQHLLQAQRAVSDVKEKLKSIRIMFQFYAARKADVIAMTSTYAAKTNFLFRLLQSKVVIFEEAAELLESHVLACLTPFTEHVVMLGDHMQLQPYTSSYHHSRISQLNISLFERIFVASSKESTLNIQYRMRPCIAELIHPLFYTKLSNDTSVEEYPKVRNMRKDLYFFTHKECELQSEDQSSYYNDFEIEHILNLAAHLIEKAAYTPDDIVILSPYAKQVEQLKAKANIVVKNRQLHITTVDSFQGLEANIVLLSLVRSDSKGGIGFLKESNRICVALSRAKHGLYVMGNIQLLAEHSEPWRAIEQKLYARDAIGNKFPLANDEE